MPRWASREGISVVPTPELPDIVHRFIHDVVPSIERLEVLLLLHDARDRKWTLEEIEERIRSTPESIRANVSALVGYRLALPTTDPVGPVRFRYAADGEADEAVVAVATAYRTHRVTVVELIYGERRDSVRGFSNAFKIGRTHDR